MDAARDEAVRLGLSLVEDTKVEAGVVLIVQRGLDFKFGMPGVYVHPFARTMLVRDQVVKLFDSTEKR